MDFVSDRTSKDQKFRVLTVVDMFSRECLAILVGQRLTGEDCCTSSATDRHQKRLSGPSSL